MKTLMTQPTAIISRSREFVEQQMHLFVGKLMRGRVAGQQSGNPKLNFGPFALDFESELLLKDGEVATFRILSLSKNHITLGFVRREGGSEKINVEENLVPKVKILLTELKLPVDSKHIDATESLLRAGYHASKENIRSVVTLDAKPGGESEASRIVEGLLHRGNDIPPKLLEALRVYIGTRSGTPVQPEESFVGPSARDIASNAAKLPAIRNGDDFSVNLRVLAERVSEGLKPIIARSTEELAANYRISAPARMSAVSTLSRVFAEFLPRYISGLHPNDALRVAFEQFQVAAGEQAGVMTQTGGGKPGAMLPSLPLQVMPAFIEFMVSDNATRPSFEQMMQAFTRVVQDALTPALADESVSSSVLLNMLKAGIGVNLARLSGMARTTTTDGEIIPGTDIVDAIAKGAESLAAKLAGSRLAEWLLTPTRPGTENLPAVGFSLPDEVKGSISLHPGVKRHGDDEDEVPAGGRLVYEGEGVGRIEIGLEYAKDGLSTLFRVERKDTAEEITALLPELGARLEGRGIGVKSLRAVHIRTLQKENDGDARRSTFPENGLDLKA